MSDLSREPIAIKHINELVDFANRNPNLSGVVYGLTSDGKRVVTICVDYRHPPCSGTSPKEVENEC